MPATLLAVSAWDYEFHPEVWLLLAAIIGLGMYSVRSIGPLVVPVGEPVVSTGQRRFFVAGVALLWFAADWPMHDIAEEHLYFVHMLQHLHRLQHLHWARHHRRHHDLAQLLLLLQLLPLPLFRLQALLCHRFVL